MKLYVLPKRRTKPSFPAPKPSDVCAGWRPPPFQSGSQASVGDKPVGSLGPEGTKAHSHPREC